MRFAHSGVEFLGEPGLPLRYPGRVTHAVVRWEHLPVTGVSVTDGSAYLAWLRATAVPGARWCDSREWVRAARGADGRSLPTGDAMPVDAANTYETHSDGVAARSGPDEVGEHPASRSPFDLHDVAGNVWEIVQGAPDAYETRGGGWYFPALNARVVNWQHRDPDARELTVGLRICATP